MGGRLGFWCSGEVAGGWSALCCAELVARCGRQCVGAGTPSPGTGSDRRRSGAGFGACWGIRRGRGTVPCRPFRVCAGTCHSASITSRSGPLRRRRTGPVKALKPPRQEPARAGNHRRPHPTTGACVNVQDRGNVPTRPPRRVDTGVYQGIADRTRVATAQSRGLSHQLSGDQLHAQPTWQAFVALCSWTFANPQVQRVRQRHEPQRTPGLFLRVRLETGCRDQLRRPSRRDMIMIIAK